MKWAIEEKILAVRHPWVYGEFKDTVKWLFTRYTDVYDLWRRDPDAFEQKYPEAPLREATSSDRLEGFARRWAPSFGFAPFEQLSAPFASECLRCCRDCIEDKQLGLLALRQWVQERAAKEKECRLDVLLHSFDQVVSHAVEHVLVCHRLEDSEMARWFRSYLADDYFPMMRLEWRRYRNYPYGITVR